MAKNASDRRLDEVLERLSRLELLLVAEHVEGVEGNEPPGGDGGGAEGLESASSALAAPSSAAQELEAFIDGLGFASFRGRELTPYWSRTRGGVRNDVPPRELWKNIVPTLAVLQRFRNETGAPVRILSTYRSPDYNRAVGGATASQHLRFGAIDFTTTVGTPAQWAARLRSYRGKRFPDPHKGTEFEFHGGIGVYTASRFVHVDTRGTDVDW